MGRVATNPPPAGPAEKLGDPQSGLQGVGDEFEKRAAWLPVQRRLADRCRSPVSRSTKLG